MTVPGSHDDSQRRDFFILEVFEPPTSRRGFRRHFPPPGLAMPRLIATVSLLLFFFSTSGRGQSPPKAPSRASVLNPGSPAAGNSASAPPSGNEACAKCHLAIATSYATKPMARGSGLATENFLPGEFRDPVSGVHYRVYVENGGAWLSFDRDGEAPLHGKRKLDYFIGSGHRGKTFVFSEDGFSFESPINFYTHQGSANGGIWDMAPKNQGAKEMPLTSPAASSCLSCHTSDAQAPEPGTDNKYASPLFAHGGITCERCHGGDLTHGANPDKFAKVAANQPLKGSAQSAIINPAKLPPDRRDAVCMQCHLEGNSAIEQPGHHFYEFRPGDDLSKFIRYYILSGDGKDSVRAVSQFEALEQSGCKRGTGPSFTCTTCHDPHSSPAPAERVSYYRAKCLSCHGEAFAAKHHTEQQDCTSCHMPSVATIDVGHTQDSDHRILRVPAASQQGPGADPKLIRFPPVNQEDSFRDVALAWVSIAGSSGSPYAIQQSEKILPQALAQSPEDAELLTAMGYSEQQKGLTDLARGHYEHALRVKPLSLDAASNLALIEANAGHLDRAGALWKAAFERAPGRSSLGIYLARALCLSGHGDESKGTIARVLRFNPDSSTAREMLRQLQSGEVTCDSN